MARKSKTNEVIENPMAQVAVPDAIDCIKRLDSRTPAMLWGEPGCGKTRTLIDKFRDHIVIPVLAGQSEPTDIGGIPFNYKDQHAKYLVPWWGFYASTHEDVKEYRMLPDGTIIHDPEGKTKNTRSLDGPMVLFFDDIVTAHEQTQAAFYKVVDEKKIGELTIRENVRIIAAGNRVDDMSAVTDMPKALCNRFMHFYVRPNVDKWLEWATVSGIHPHVTFFVRNNQQHLSGFEDAKNSTQVHAWPTPRTWEMLSRTLHELDTAGLRSSTGDASEAGVDYEYTMIQGCIGALASSFHATIRNKFQIVTVEEILKNPSKAEVPPLSQPDRLYATVSNLEYWYAQKENHDKYEPFITYTLRLPDDFGVLLARQFVAVLTSDGMDEKLSQKIMQSQAMWSLFDKWNDKIQVDLG